ncbi:hydrolase [Hyphomonas sp.]|jgi:glutamate carboxypeptidase|uniref:hydrolase n=1 Tax=Hyphomonas sp. TaxID=87 RepID=UPI003003A066|eukprot:TRINITY_DN21071_c0_g1_i1.p1 TRINITY_DN21071_c0_g1~~TRINITY_DN21071_c0_g1_i1.p1  ORF type:complete len:420 (-),score=71.14 TRINITY_DN21071_c0_g1_i1:1898-3157(-)
MDTLQSLSPDDEAARERLFSASHDMVQRTCSWSDINTGSWNTAGLEAFAPMLADAFSELQADVDVIETEGFEAVGASGKAEMQMTGPVIEVTGRPDADVQIIMSGHYDTVFPAGTFQGVTDLGDGRLNGPGMADMKGGLCVMLEALKAFEAGPLKDRLGYRIVLTPDEEIGNFASAQYLTRAAKSGAMIGMTYEPAMETGAMSGGRKGSAVFDIVLHGKAAHAGRAKEEGRSAIEAAAELVLGLEALNGQREGVTFNVGSIDGGSAVNIVPDLAIVRFGARAPDADSAEWATTETRKLFERAIARNGISGHLHGGFYRPPKPRNAAQQALFDAVHATGQAIGLDLEFVDTGGVCEGNNIFAAGVPNVDTLGVRGGRIHSNEEYVVTDSFAERATLSALLLNRLADGRLDARRIKSLMGQ